MPDNNKYNLITILGHTAGGKTALAAHLAGCLGSGVISADSRQVYRKMNIGTGKDYNDYFVDGKQVPYYLIDIVEPGYKYNLYEYQQNFIKVFKKISGDGKIPVLCGGTGLYIEAVLKGYKLLRVPVNNDLRKELENKPLDELTRLLASYKKLHNKTDADTVKRAVRAIEIEDFHAKHSGTIDEYPEIKSLNIGIAFDREQRRKRISERLKTRIENGMIDEVKQLLDSGVTKQDLIYYGLEYKFITQYLTGELTYDEMYSRLETAIHRFAKRQMTWFKGMERRGLKIYWLDGNMDLEQKVAKVFSLYNNFKS